MWSGAVLLGICLVSVFSYQIGKMKGWDEWDKQDQIRIEADEIREAFKK